MAELADARDLKSLDGNIVRVRSPSPAPKKGTASAVPFLRYKGPRRRGELCSPARGFPRVCGRAMLAPTGHNGTASRFRRGFPKGGGIFPNQIEAQQSGFDLERTSSGASETLSLRTGETIRSLRGRSPPLYALFPHFLRRKWGPRRAGTPRAAGIALALPGISCYNNLYNYLHFEVLCHDPIACGSLHSRP